MEMDTCLWIPGQGELHLTLWEGSYANNTRRCDCLPALEARFGVADLLSNATAAHYPLLHGYCVFYRGHRCFRQMVAPRHGGRRPQGIATKQPHPHLRRWPVFRRLSRGRHRCKCGQSPHRRLLPTKAEAKKFGRQRGKVVILKYGDDETPPDKLLTLLKGKP